MQCGTKRVRSVRPQVSVRPRAAPNILARRRLNLEGDDCQVDASFLLCDERMDVSFMLCDERLHAAEMDTSNDAARHDAPAEPGYVPTPSPAPLWTDPIFAPIFVPVPPAFSIAEWQAPARLLSANENCLSWQLSAEHKERVWQQLLLLFPDCTRVRSTVGRQLQDTPFVAGLRTLFVFSLFGSGGRVDAVVLMHSMLLWTLATRALCNFDINLAVSCWSIAGKFHNAKVMRREMLVCQLKFAAACRWRVVQDVPLHTIAQVRLLKFAVMTDEITVLSALQWNVRLRVVRGGILVDPLHEIHSVLSDRPALAEDVFAELVFRELAFVLVDLNS